MLRAITIIFAASAMLPFSAAARLWDSKADLDARYGKPHRFAEDADGKNYTYRFKQFEVLVTLLDGKSQSELYYHRDNRPITPADIQTILSLNALGNSWRTTEGVFALVKPSGGHPIAVGAYDADAKPPVLGVCPPDFVKKKSGSVFGKKASH